MNSTALAVPSETEPALDYGRARYNMIECQLRPNKVTDEALLGIMGRIPRENFVPSTLTGVAYLDDNIPLIAGRCLMQPMVLARLIQALALTDRDHVLDLAPATGYSTVIMAALAQSVVAVEPNALLQKEADRNAAGLAPRKSKILAGAPDKGCASLAPFDAILLNGSAEFLPEILFDQLTEGGRLAAVIRQYDQGQVTHTGQARLYRKKGGEVTWISLFETHLPVAPGFIAPHGFTF